MSEQMTDYVPRVGDVLVRNFRSIHVVAKPGDLVTYLVSSCYSLEHQLTTVPVETFLRDARDGWHLVYRVPTEAGEETK